MAIQIRRAERKKAKLRLGIMGSSGSGKTYSALQLAFGLGGKIGLIDTEHGSGELYANLGEYDVIQIEAPYTVNKYREAIKAFEDAGYGCIIIDSLTHAWAGEGGLLDKQGQLEKSGKFKNSFATWREITPEHNKLVEELLNSPCHIIGTMRSKTEYVLEQNEKGRQVPRKIGLAPVQREGMEYEFTVVLDISDNHYAVATKDRTMLFDGWSDRITKETGKKILDWLESGVDAPPKPAEPSKQERLQTAAATFLELLSKCDTKLAVTSLVAKNNALMKALHEELPELFDKLSKEINQHNEAFDLAEAAE
jgi:AAA domain